MKLINTRVHGGLDYLVALLQILGPFILGFRYDTPQAFIPMLLGALIILYSLCTDYEYSLAKKISMSTHLILDSVAAMLLLFSPWIFQFAGQVYWPHVIVGIIELIVVLLSKKKMEGLLEKMHRNYYNSRDKF